MKKILSAIFGGKKKVFYGYVSADGRTITTDSPEVYRLILDREMKKERCR